VAQEVRRTPEVEDKGVLKSQLTMIDCDPLERHPTAHGERLRLLPTWKPA
jgi:hypothetical protein